MGFGLVFEGVFAGHSNGLCGCPVNRWSTKRPPNGTKLDRWSPGGVIRPLVEDIYLRVTRQEGPGYS